MSGIIAVWHGSDFIGRYHYGPSHPSALGATLYRWAQMLDRRRMLRLLLEEHPAGWYNIVGTNYLHPTFQHNPRKYKVYKAANRKKCYYFVF